MSLPQFKKKYLAQSILDPAKYLHYLQSKNPKPCLPAPHAVIFCYQPRLLSYIRQKHQAVKGDSYHSRFLYLPEYENKIAVVGGFGIGAPAATVVLEEMIAMGVEKFITVGTAGTLQANINIGDLILCNGSLRDEGVSFHYIEPKENINSDLDIIYAENKITDLLRTTLKSESVPFHEGLSWTIDTPYRETIDEVRSYQQKNILCVEMEAAALMAVAQYRKKSLGCLLTISDSLADLEWDPQFHSEATQSSLEKLFQVSVLVLSKT